MTTDPNEALERAILVLGGPVKLLAVLKRKPGRDNIKGGHLYHWRKKSGLPAEYCPDVEAATLALGQAVTCEELNPRVDWGFIRASGGVAANDTSNQQSA